MCVKGRKIERERVSESEWKKQKLYCGGNRAQFSAIKRTCGCICTLVRVCVFVCKVISVQMLLFTVCLMQQRGHRVRMMLLQSVLLHQ